MSRRSNQRVDLRYSVISEWKKDSSGKLRSTYIGPGESLGSVLRMEVYFNPDEDPKESFSALFTEAFVAKLKRESRGAPLYLVLRSKEVQQHAHAIVQEVFTRCGTVFPKVFC